MSSVISDTKHRMLRNSKQMSTSLLEVRRIGSELAEPICLWDGDLDSLWTFRGRLLWRILGCCRLCCVIRYPFILLAYVGPQIRDRLPTGVTLADYVRIRLGRPMQIYVGLISVLYMFTFLFAEFTAIGKATETLSMLNLSFQCSW